MRVFSGTVTVPSAGTGVFDFVIPFSSPFVYDPAHGNLLLDVFINLNSQGANPFVGADTWMIGRLFNLSGTGAPTSNPNRGLLTQFTGTRSAPVPEPATFGLLSAGLTTLYARSRRRRGRPGR